MRPVHSTDAGGLALIRNLPITEDTPLHNPYWAYSRAKAAMEQMLRAQRGLPFTIVRPSHTYRTKMPMGLPGGDIVDDVENLLKEY